MEMLVAAPRHARRPPLRELASNRARVACEGVGGRDTVEKDEGGERTKVHSVSEKEGGDGRVTGGDEEWRGEDGWAIEQCSVCGDGIRLEALEYLLRGLRFEFDVNESMASAFGDRRAQGIRTSARKTRHPSTSAVCCMVLVGEVLRCVSFVYAGI